MQLWGSLFQVFLQIYRRPPCFPLKPENQARANSGIETGQARPFCCIQGILVLLCTQPAIDECIAMRTAAWPVLIHDIDVRINRRLTASEFREAMDMAKQAGLKRLDPRDRIRFALF